MNKYNIYRKGKIYKSMVDEKEKKKIERVLSILEMDYEIEEIKTTGDITKNLKLKT